MDRARLQKLAQANSSEARFDLVMTLIDRLLARLARTGATGQTLHRRSSPGEAAMLARLSPDPAAGRAWAEAAEGLTARARQGRAVNLDPSLLILDMCLALAQKA